MKILVVTHSGREDELEVLEYNPTELISEINDKETHNILIGENIYAKIDIKHISKIVL